MRINDPSSPAATERLEALNRALGATLEPAEVEAWVQRSAANHPTLKQLQTALDVLGLEDWMAQTLRASTHTARCRRAIASTHGAALVALGDETRACLR